MNKQLLSMILLGSAVASQAAIVFEEGNFTGGDNVLSGSIEGPAVLVKGEINSGGPVVVFFNNDGNDMTYTGGQATLEGAGNSDPLMDFTVTLEDPTLWTAGMGMTLDADDDGDVLFTVSTNEGIFTDTFAYQDNGNNKYRILASGTTQILGVRVETTTELDAVKQVRINAVPEPGTMAALALGAAGFLRRRNRK